MRLAAILFGLVLLVPLGAHAACVNAGTDQRKFAKVICALQGALSFRSFHKPVGVNIHGNIFVGFPPIVAFNIPKGEDKYLHGRFGWRWDSHPATEPEKGCFYIFPSIALKVVSPKQEFWKDNCIRPTS